MRLCVDFRLIDQPEIGKTKDPYETYDETTRVYYKSHRKNKIDPITYDELIGDKSFKFPYMWNPYTGMRLCEDPIGPLYFHPMNLLKHLYDIRLKRLWIDPSNDDDGLYGGYYGDGVGQGEDFEIIGHGNYPERYIFRIPIQDLYLSKSHKIAIITMGPKITTREIHELDRLIVKHWSKHKLYDRIYKKIGSLYILKCYYEIAISKTPLTMNLQEVKLGTLEDIMKQQNPSQYLNRIAIDTLKKMI